MNIPTAGKGKVVGRALVITSRALTAAGGESAVARLCAERSLNSEFALRREHDYNDLDLQASWLIDSHTRGFVVALGADRLADEGFRVAVCESMAAALNHVRAAWQAQPTFSSYRAAAVTVEQLHLRGQLVFTNGVFDLLHAGHLRSLEYARGLGDALVVGLNSDISVNGLRRAGRPVIGQFARAELLAALRCVDAVIIFDEPEPLDLIETVRPDILVKGGTYTSAGVAGGDAVRGAGGLVALSPVLSGTSTSAIIKRIIQEGPE